MRSLNDRSGEAANGTASAPSTLKLRSGTGHLAPRAGLRFQFGEETIYLPPDLRAARKAAPVHSDEADEFEALVNRRDVVFARAAHAVDEQRFRVRLQLFEHGVGAHKVFPRVEREQRLGRARRTRIESNDLPRVAAAVEEGHAGGE